MSPDHLSGLPPQHEILGNDREGQREKTASLLDVSQQIAAALHHLLAPIFMLYAEGEIPPGQDIAD